MPYCVKCGVELDKSAKKCVLCNTEVMMKGEESVSPYPKEKAAIQPVNSRYAAALLSILFMIPNFACLVINLMYLEGVYWMYYVFGGTCIIWVIAVFPMLLKRKRYLLYIFMIFMSAVLYTLLISLALDGLNWFITLALPVSAAIWIMLAILLLIWNKKKPGKLRFTCMCLFCIMVLSIIIDMCIDSLAGNVISPSWSYIVMASITPIIVALMLLSRNKKLQNELLKKLHI